VNGVNRMTEVKNTPLFLRLVSICIPGYGYEYESKKTGSRESKLRFRVREEYFYGTAVTADAVMGIPEEQLIILTTFVSLGGTKT